MNSTRLNNLGKLLDFGAKCLNCEKINVNIRKLRGAKKVFFPMLIAAHNYTEGIYSLCSENRSHPCFPLLRSLCENHINAKFLYCAPIKHSYVIFLDGLSEKKKMLNHALDYSKQSPTRSLETKVSVKDITQSLKKVKNLEKEVVAKINKYPGKLILGTSERAKFVDEHNIKKNAKSSSLEWNYILYFRTLSSSTHMNFLDFPNYFKQEGREMVIFLSGNPDDINDILDMADFFYKEMLNMFLKIFKSPFKDDFKNIYISK